MRKSEGAAVGAAVVLAASILGAAPPSGPALLPAAGFLCAMAVWIATVDGRCFTIPDGPVAAIGIVGAALRLAAGNAGPGIASRDIALTALDAVLWSGCLLALRETYYRRRGVDGIGLGDVKLAAAGSILVGSTGFAWALLAASGAALLTVWVIRHLAAHRHVERIAFGAFLAPACCGIWIAQTGGWV